MGDGVLSEVNAALVHDLLHLKGHEHGKALGGQGAEGVDAAHTDRQRGIQTVKLLELQCCHLAHVLSRNSQNCLGVAVQLFFGFCGNDHGENRHHHTLVTGSQIVQELFAFLAL